MSNNTEHTPSAPVAKESGYKINVAVGKEVAVLFPGTPHSYRGRVVGYDPYEYIIVSVRLPCQVRRELECKGQVVLKYIHQGTVYGFRTHVTGCLRTPAPLLFIEYPAVIEKIDLRREARADVHIDGELHLGDTVHECMIVNLSTTGCKVSARATARDPLSKAEVDDSMLVSFSIGSGGVLKLPMAVRNIRRKKDILTLGGMFVDLNSREVEALGKHLEKVRRLSI